MTDGSDVMRQFIPNSPFAAQLGLELDEIADGRARVRMPFKPELATVGDMVHGGAIATLADVAVMAASWAGAEVPEQLKGATVSLATTYLNAARGEDLVADARVLRRGAQLVFVECDVLAPGDRPVAKVLGTYKVG